jgi:hypothetical protein
MIFRGFLILVLCGVMAGCGGGGGDGGGDSPPPNPAEGSNWDEMVWDQGKWR